MLSILCDNKIVPVIKIKYDDMFFKYVLCWNNPVNVVDNSMGVIVANVYIKKITKLKNKFW